MKSGYIILIGLLFVIVGLVCGITNHNMYVNATMCGIGGVLIGNGIRISLK